MYVDKCIKIIVDKYRNILVNDILQVIHNLKTLDYIDKLIDLEN